jgi:heterodisulfide reductase subunit C2
LTMMAALPVYSNKSAGISKRMPALFQNEIIRERVKVNFQFVTDINTKANQNISLCYQCKKCAAGCPVSDIMEYKNYEILRLIQMGKESVVRKANTPWICVGCRACSTRCPNGIDTARIMDVLKEETLISKGVIPERKVAAFHAAFLETVRQFGRSFELGLVGIYKLKTGTFMQDMVIGIKMMLRGKLSFLPHRIKGIQEMKRIFAQAKEREK